MTIWELLRALVRRWYVCLLAGALALGGTYVVRQQDGVYWTRAEVTFLAPTSEINPNVLRVTSSDLIIAAAVVAKRINGNLVWNKLADPATTLVGQGVRDGWSVRLPDYGGQWSRVYSRQVLDVQVTGPTEQAVRDRLADLFAQIDGELALLQEGSRSSDLITTMVVPQTPAVYHVTGRPMRAVVMIWVLCGGAALAVVGIWESRVRRPARRVSRSAARPADEDEPARPEAARPDELRRVGT